MVMGILCCYWVQLLEFKEVSQGEADQEKGGKTNGFMKDNQNR
jgi:hypothetical protein